MALEALVFQLQGSYDSHGCSDIYVLGGSGGPGSYCQLGLEEDKVCSFETSPDNNLEGGFNNTNLEAPAATMGRLKRRRTRSSKNKEEKENQRMTHIAVERNRRKQMNDYLAVLRSMMPPSYVQKVLHPSIFLFPSIVK